MRHRRLGYRKSDKDKEQEMVIEAAVYAAAMATADAIRQHDEELEQKYPLMYITESDTHEAFLKLRGVAIERVLAGQVHRETCKAYQLQPFETKVREVGRSKKRQHLADVIAQYYKSASKAAVSREVVLREVPRMSVEKSQAISRRMFARTADDMAQELYDDAE